MWKRLLRWMAVPGVLVALVAGAVLAGGNCCRAEPDATEIDAAYEAAVGWLMTHRARLSHNQNMFLWWMLREAADVSGDSRIGRLVAGIARENRDVYDGTAWSWLAVGEPGSFKRTDLTDRPDYNLHMLYGLSCEPSLEALETIRAQNRLDFCSTTHPFAPSCPTHQLMGLRLIKRSGCPEPADVDAMIDALGARIARHEFLDVRVTDVYLQRALVLAEAGQWERLRATWIGRILDAQREDGGWADLHPIIGLGGGRVAGFNSKGPVVTVPRSQLHTTAQGVWLLALLKAQSGA